MLRSREVVCTVCNGIHIIPSHDASDASDVWSSFFSTVFSADANCPGLQRYVREDLRRLDCNPARLLSGAGRDGRKVWML